MVHTLKNNERCPHGIFRRWWIGKNGAQQWSKALDDEGGALGAIEMIFKAGAATQQARIEALESLLRDVHDDLLLRAVTDTQGHKVVAVGFSIWERMKKLLELERREKILHESLECGHDLVEEQPCAQCRLEARIEALKAAIGNINTQKEIVMKYAKESDRLMAVGRMYQAIADAAALLEAEK